MPRRYSHIATAPLYIRISNRLVQIPATAYIRLQHTGTQVYQSVNFQSGAHGNSSQACYRRIMHTDLATDDDMASPLYARLERIKRATDFHQVADKNVILV